MNDITEVAAQDTSATRPITQQNAPQTGLAMSEMELLDVLQVSIYPGAARTSIKLAMAYCSANSLDIFQKPVHIVPMWDKASRAMRDVIMPGVGLYRTQAARSGALAGITEPEFGPSIDIVLDGVTFNVPEWCRITVSRILSNGSIAKFSSLEYWIENYATAGKDSAQPNTMWKKRPRGQLAKCSQAQALRTAFPEMIGAAPTADEMEGKPMNFGGEIDVTPATQQPKAVAAPIIPVLAECTDEHFDKNKAAWRDVVLSGRKTSAALISMLSTKLVFTEEQKMTVDSWSHEQE